MLNSTSIRQNKTPTHFPIRRGVVQVFLHIVFLFVINYHNLIIPRRSRYIYLANGDISTCRPTCRQRRKDMWVTIYFKSGKVTETIIWSFAELDKRKDKDDIDRIEMGTTMPNRNSRSKLKS